MSRFKSTSTSWGLAAQPHLLPITFHPTPNQTLNPPINAHKFPFHAPHFISTWGESPLPISASAGVQMPTFRLSNPPVACQQTPTWGCPLVQRRHIPWSPLYQSLNTRLILIIFDFFYEWNPRISFLWIGFCCICYFYASRAQYGLFSEYLYSSMLISEPLCHQ